MGGTFISIRHTPNGSQTRTQTNLSTGVKTQQSGNATYGWRDTQETMSYRTSGREGDVEVTSNKPGEFIRLLKESGYFRNPEYDIGHEFFTKKITRTCGAGGGKMEIYSPPSGSPALSTFRNYIRTGNQYKVGSQPFRDCESDPNPSWFIQTDDIASGKAAIAAAAPTRPVANLSTTFGELFSGLPTLIGATLLRDRIGVFRGLGSEYLNVQFGWLPLISDIKKMIYALQNASTILTQYEKDSGRNIRRRYTLPSQRVTYFCNSAGGTVSAGNASRWESYDHLGKLILSGGGGPAPVVDQSSLVVSVSAQQDRWFSGAFTYYIPPSGTLKSDIDRWFSLSNKLLGTSITPEVLWNLAPWSWLIDWIAAIGNHISVYQRFETDELVLRYGYLMVRDRVNVSSNYSMTYRTPAGANAGKAQGYSQVRVDQKRRVRSTPFGFGLTSSDFNARQWSILAALGMTKSPRSLR